jgi:hypothetical protein
MDDAGFGKESLELQTRTRRQLLLASRFQYQASSTGNFLSDSGHCKGLGGGASDRS